MKLDNVNVDILANAAKAAGTEIDIAHKIIEGLYKGVNHVIVEEKGQVKIDHFGKFIYSDAWKAKKENLAKPTNFSALKVV